MMHQEKIKFVLTELIEKRNLDAVEEVFSPDYTVHMSKKDYLGYNCIKKWVKDLNKYLTDLKVVNIEFLHQNDDVIVWKRQMKGRIRPSDNTSQKAGKILKWSDMIVSKFQNGKIAEEWVVSEFLGELIRP